MKSDKHRRSINFDISRQKLIEHYPNKNKNNYLNGYRDLGRVFHKLGYMHRQYSTYDSIKELSIREVLRDVHTVSQKLPWLKYCIDRVDVTNIENIHSIKCVFDEDIEREQQSYQEPQVADKFEDELEDEDEWEM